MPRHEESRRIEEEAAPAGGVAEQELRQMLHAVHEDLDKFREENRKRVDGLDKMLSDFRRKSRSNTAHISSIAEKTASFILDSCHKDQNRARQVYELFEEVLRMLRKFAEESERQAETVARVFAQFSGQEACDKDRIAEACRITHEFLELLSRKRHERREDVQVILGQLRLENRERVEWVSSMLAKLRAADRDRSQDFEAKDAKIARDVRTVEDKFITDQEDIVQLRDALKAAVELCRTDAKAGDTE